MAQTLHPSPPPPVEERLCQLRPSRELLEYYREKVADFDVEHEEMVKRLEAYRCTYEEHHKVQHTIRQREQEIAELQKALSDMQVFLFQEREQVLRLHAENDRLRLRELQDRQRIQHLLSLTQPGNCSSDVTYLQPMGNGGDVMKKLDRCHVERNTSHPHHAKFEQSNDVESKGTQKQLALTVQALQAQLEEQTRLAKQQVDALLQDRQVALEETQARAERDTETIASLSEKLQKTQNILYDSTRDFLALKYDIHARERAWMSEKDELMCNLDEMKRLVEESNAASALFSTTQSGMDTKENRQDLLSGATDVRTAYKMELHRLREALQQQQQLAEAYRDQCTELEDLHSRMREKQETNQQSFSQRAERMAQRLALMNDRYKNLERRRNLEREGFSNDIKSLRSRLKDLENQLYKVTVNFDGACDTDVLEAVQRTAGHTKQLIGELHGLKTKVYGVEHELRHHK